MAACLPLVQAWVATKILALTPSAAASSPVTDSEEPYIGELSITRPPSSTKTFRDSRACAFSFGAGPAVNPLPGPRPAGGDGFAVFRDAPRKGATRRG